NIVVQDLGDGQAASDLGISKSSSTNTLTGDAIQTRGADTALATLNDGRGIRLAGGGGDFRATLSDGSAVDVTLAIAQNVGDVIKAINAAGGAKLKATLDANSESLDLADTSGGG